jgi:hypothetical protein
MRKFAYAAVAIATIGAWSVPSQADMWTGPIQQEGKCWKNSFPQGIGYWTTCAKPAAATVPTRQVARRHHS